MRVGNPIHLAVWHVKIRVTNRREEKPWRASPIYRVKSSTAARLEEGKPLTDVVTAQFGVDCLALNP
jgi:hypothetical protein